MDTKIIKKPDNNNSIQAWIKLWEFANSEIAFYEGNIDFDSFYESGKELFNIELKIPQ